MTRWSVLKASLREVWWMLGKVKVGETKDVDGLTTSFTCLEDCSFWRTLYYRFEKA